MIRNTFEESSFIVYDVPDRVILAWNITNKMRKKMGKPTYLFDRTLSIMWVVR